MLRCKPQHLHFEAQSQVGKRIIYHDDKDFDQMTKPAFWSNVIMKKSNDRLKPGDRLCIMKVEYESTYSEEITKVIGIRNLIVSEVDKYARVHFIDENPPAPSKTNTAKPAARADAVAEKAA